MADGATVEDVISYSKDEPLQPKSYLEEHLKAASGELAQFGDNPLSKIDFARAEAINSATYAEKKGKYKKEFELKRLFLRYAKKYALKWNAVMNYPKQIKQKPAWFDLALSMFKENEISSKDKKIIIAAFNRLWEFRDRAEPERVMSEEESLRQYGVASPYYQQPESAVEGLLPPSEEMAPTDILPQSGGESFIVPPTPEPESTFQPKETGNVFGVRKIVPEEKEDYLSGYMTGFKSNIVDMTPFSPKPSPKPQGEVTLGLTPSAKKTGGSGSGAFNIGRELFSSFRGGESLKSIMTPTKPTLPTQQVQVSPAEVITVAQQPNVLQRKSVSSKSSVDRTTRKISSGLAKFRSIELPSFPKPKMSSISTKSKVVKSRKPKGLKTPTIKGVSDINSMFSNIKSKKIKSSATFNKTTIGNMSTEIKKSVGEVVGGIKVLKNQVHGELKKNESIKSLNLKNLKSNKVKTNRDLNVLNKLKMDTHAQISRGALECKMVPKLHEQCGKVFGKNQITKEVSKFKNDFKDVSKAVPTVKGEKARLIEVGILGDSIRHGVDGAHVEDVRSMYKNSGSTQQMNIGMMEYDYSFATGAKKKIKTPPIVDDYYEIEEV